MDTALDWPREVIPMTAGGVAHQEIVFNLRTVLGRLLALSPLHVLHEMRLRIGARIRYPDSIVFTGPLDQTTRTLADAAAYVLLEQTAMAATVLHSQPGGPGIATAQTAGDIRLPGIDITLPLADLDQGLTFPR